ncbi:NADP-dependent oxidoreductase domain-containing protein [Trichophaea hybrida]|nr:NADP-dependent oxidoreductase domain-containing protein [Trichophaea hybrida]
MARSTTTATARKPLSEVLPPLVLGTATFTHQYNHDPHSLATTAIIHHALSSGIRAFDTSPYYGPAETLLGDALQSQSLVPRSDYILQSKCGRIAADKFDYSPAWIRQSIEQSLQRLGTEYLDVIFCHDVEFVEPWEVFSAVQTLRELRDQGFIRYVGISGYPTDVLALLAQQVKDRTGEPLDAVMSYANYTLQNTQLFSKALDKLVDAGVDCVLNGSPLGMGLLRTQGVPVGDMGDFHPAPNALRDRCVDASNEVQKYGEKGGRLEILALRFSIEGWVRDGALAGTTVRPLLTSVADDTAFREVGFARPRVGVNVIGASYMHELEELVKIWTDVVSALEREFLYQKVVDVFGEEWRDYTWPSPGEGYVRGGQEKQADTLIKSRM